MNREIKFRGKCSHCDAWAYGNLVDYGEDEAPEIHGFDHYRENEDEWREITVDRETVGQFTGLHDKKGNEIYEGDVLMYYRVDTRCINPDCDLFNRIYESYLKKVVGVVCYEDGMFTCEDYSPLVWCGLENLEELRNDLDATEEDGWSDCDGNIIDESKLGIVILGNIHDNPELI